MIRISAIALAAGLAMTGASLAHADSAVAGKWNYTIGASTPCTVTLTANDTQTAGDIASGADCAAGLSTVAHWREVGSKLHLMSPAGDLVVVLSPKDSGYTGKQIDGGRKVALSR